jgi:hypothetical protein
MGKGSIASGSVLHCDEPAVNLSKSLFMFQQMLRQQL